MALSSCAPGQPLAGLSSLAGTGNTAQLQGNHSAGNLRFHLSPIHSGTYLERRGGRCACHEPEGRARLFFLDEGGQVGAGLNRSHVRVGAARQVVFHGGVIKLSYGDFIELLKATDVTQYIFQ